MCMLRGPVLSQHHRFCLCSVRSSKNETVIANAGLQLQTQISFTALRTCTVCNLVVANAVLQLQTQISFRTQRTFTVQRNIFVAPTIQFWRRPPAIDQRDFLWYLDRPGRRRRGQVVVRAKDRLAKDLYNLR